MDKKRILGIVLAGGKSSRMGQNKALLCYQGHSFIEHMVRILTSESLGITDTVISGIVTGYDKICVPDTVPFAGPAYAIQNIMTQYTDYDGYIVVPVDMPLLCPEIITYLLQSPKGAVFTGHPLPVYIVPPVAHTYPHITPDMSMKHMVHIYNVPVVSLPDVYMPCMKNINTPTQWQEITKECK